MDTTLQDFCYEGWMKWHQARCLACCQALKAAGSYSFLKKETTSRWRMLLFSIQLEQILVLFPLRGGWRCIDVGQGEGESQLDRIVSGSWWHWCSSGNREALSDTSPTPERLNAEIMTWMTGFHFPPNFPAYMVNLGVLSVCRIWGGI